MQKKGEVIVTYADLHIHSTFSDSSRTPEEIARIAKSRKVSLVSLCDHSTIDGYERFANACAASGMSCVPGVELGAHLDGESYHVLAYNFDPADPSINRFIRKQKQQGDSECEDMIARMSLDYPMLSLEDYRDYQEPRDQGGWKYIYYAVARGAFPTYAEAGGTIYAKYFIPHPDECPVEDFCEITISSGGVPVLAHPGYVYRRNPDGFTAFLRKMHDRGIGGVECFYPLHTREITEACLDYCRKNGLRITTGSDCHGSFDKTPGFTIGSLKITLDMLDLRGIFDG